MRIAVISSSVFPLPPLGYSGLEMIAYYCAKGLAEKGHQVTVFAPLGSNVPGCEVIQCLPPGFGEEQMFSGCVWKTHTGEEVRWPGYWQRFIDSSKKDTAAFDVCIDHSIPGDENLLVRINGTIKWISFDDLYSWALTCSQPVLLDNRGGSEVVVNGLEVPSAVDCFSVEWRRVGSIVKHKRRDHIYNVRMRGGLSVCSTAGHSLMVAGGNGELEPKRADTSEGSFSAFARELPSNREDLVYWPVGLECIRNFRVRGENVHNIISKYEDHLVGECSMTTKRMWDACRVVKSWSSGGVKLHRLPQAPDSFDIILQGNRVVKWPIRLSDNALVLIGLWLGDGFYSGNSSVELASGIKTIGVAKRVAGEMKARCTLSKRRPDVYHRIHSSLLVNLMRGAGLTGYSDTKIIPEWVFNLSRRQIGLVLRGYFSSDGHIGKRLCLNSVNEKMIKQVSILLALCGIRHNISRTEGQKNKWSGERAYPIWEITVTREEYPIFIERVGFVQGSKLQRLRWHIRHSKKTAIGRRGDIPESLVDKKAHRHEFYKSGLVSITRIERLLGEEAAFRYKNASLGWRRVEESLETSREDEFVYDLTVPGTENFFVGLICCHNSWNCWLAGIKMEGRLGRMPVLKTLHAPANTHFNSIPPEGVISFVCISEDQKNHFEALFSPRKARVVKNGIDLNVYRPLGTPRSSRFLFLARFSSIKGPDIAIKSCKEAGAELDLIGDTTITQEPEYYNQCVSNCDGKRIKVIGNVPRGEVVWWYSQAHVMLHPNMRFKEPLGLAPLEAQACGAPVIAFDFGAMRETVRHNETGYLVKSEAEFMEAVHLHMQPIPEHTRRRCVEWASEFSIDKMVGGYEDLCQRAVDGEVW